MTQNTRPIAFFIRQLSGGGAQKIMIKLANAAAEHGYAVEIITLQSKGDFSGLVHPKIPVTQLPNTRLLTCVFALARHLRRAPPRSLVATEVAVNIVAILGAMLSGRRRDIRVVAREALYPSIAKKNDPYLATRIGYHICRFFYPRADAIIAIARAMVPDLARVAHVDPSRIVAIPFNPCVDANLLAAANSPPPHPWLATDRTIPCLLAVGRLSEQKDFATLIRGFARVRQQRPVRLLVVGEGELRADLQAQIDAAGLAADVVLLGHHGNPYSFMAHTDAFVMTSIYEGLGNVLIEAVACGAPCIATDCLVGPRETLCDGDYGRLVPVGDDAALAAAIIATLNNPPDRQRLRDRGQAYTSTASMQHYMPVILGETHAA